MYINNITLFMFITVVLTGLYLITTNLKYILEQLKKLSKANLTLAENIRLLGEICVEEDKKDMGKVEQMVRTDMENKEEE